MKERYIKVGLTGGFGTGKTTVARMFQDLGASIFDADARSRRLLRKGTEEYKRVIEIFGEKILDKQGRINRRALAQKVFGHPRRLARLNGIMHPPVIKNLEEDLERSGSPVRMAIIPLLFELDLKDRFDFVAVVKAAPANVRRRIRESRRMSPEEIKNREISQLPLEEKLRKADFVIDNDGPLSHTRKQVEAIWKKMRRELKSRSGF